MTLVGPELELRGGRRGGRDRRRCAEAGAGCCRWRGRPVEPGQVRRAAGDQRGAGLPGRARRDRRRRRCWARRSTCTLVRARAAAAAGGRPAARRRQAAATRAGRSRPTAGGRPPSRCCGCCSGPAGRRVHRRGPPGPDRRSPGRVTSDSDRTGVRLDGPALARRRKLELPSEGMVAGLAAGAAGRAADPVPGQPPDDRRLPGDRGGGRADLPLAAQARPGTRLRFRFVSVAQARQAAGAAPA